MKRVSIDDFNTWEHLVLRFNNLLTVYQVVNAVSPDPSCDLVRVTIRQVVRETFK